MKINDMINEQEYLTLENDLSFNDLSSLHIAALRAIDEGRMDVDNASDRMMFVLYELQEFTLVDDEYNLTRMGYKAIMLAHRLGGSLERRRAGTQKDIDLDDIEDIEFDPNDVYDDDYAGYDSTLDDYDSIFNMNRTGSIR